MANKHLTVPPSDIALSRLKVLLESVNDLYHSGNMVLESDVVSSFHEALNLFYESLDGSILSSVMKIYAGAPADPSVYNVFTTAMLKDAQAVFSEIGALDRMIASTFNSIVSEREQALRVSKNVSNKLGDYLLYADPLLGAGYFFGDSFSTSDRIEIGSSLVDTDECFLSTDEGVILLPLDGDPDIPSVKSIVVNDNSNGESGSNYQLDVFGHEDIETISDSEPNTWFEYERVTTSESTTPLVLDITIVLEEVSVVNHINVNPINFGTPTPIRIAKLETSKDGVEYTSVKDEVPLKDFISEEEREDFDLSPSASKFSGQGFYSFLPRKVQYLHIVFEQHTPYTIETNNGLRLRYAIGIRDIDILGRKFLPEGSLVSAPFTSLNNIRKVSLWASENPVEESILADIKHFISYNDGALWLPIQPQHRIGTEIPEVVNFNNISANSIETEEDVTTLRHKVSLKRDKESFKGDVTIKQERLKKMDVVSTPAGGQFDVTLTEKPIKQSVNVMFPFLGSFSCPRARFGSAVKGQSALMDLDFIEFTVDAPGERTKADGTKEGTIRFKLPFKGVPSLEEKIRVFVNGEQIEYCPKVNSIFATPPTSHTSIDQDSKVYFLNKKGTQLQFGHTDDTDTQRGYVPTGGSKIQICLDGDNPFLRLTDRGYILNLTAPSDGQKESVSIVALTNMSDNEAKAHEIEIPPGTEKYKGLTDTEAVPENSLTEAESAAIKSSIKIAPTAVKLYSSVLGKVSGTVQTKTSYTGKTTTQSEYDAQKKGSGDIDVIPSDQLTLDKQQKKELDHQNEDQVPTTGSHFSESYEGMFPPVYLEGIDNFDIVEYDSTGEVVTGVSRQFTSKVAFEDGDTELRDTATWAKVPERYTFDPYTGAAYLGSSPNASRRTVLVCKKRTLKVIDPMFWRFDKNIVTGKINTQKVVLDPRVVFTMKRTEGFTHTGVDVRKIALVSDNDVGHNWTNIMLVRGTVKPDKSLFAEGALPIEIKFVDGESEFSNIVDIKDETISFSSIGGNQYTFQLSQIDLATNKNLIGAPAFASVRDISSATTPQSQFDLVPQPSTATLSTDGEWKVSSSGLVTFYYSSTPGTHVVDYRVKNADPGIDISGMYSVDYNSGAIHFAQPIVDDGDVSFEVSAYSAFYNLAEEVSSGDIETVDEDTRTVTFNSAFGMRFLKQDTASKARPQVLKIFYEYYKKASESLEDLEPYFSPICKDLAFRAVTADLLEEL